MKKLSFILGLFVVIALSSCNKTKDCSCTSYLNGESTGESTSGSIEDGDCSDLNTSSGTGDYMVEVKCTED